MRPSVITSLRDIIPLRPLTLSEHMMLAEKQAARLRTLTEQTDYQYDQTRITALPRIEVRYLRPWPTSGATQWINGRWVIVINAGEPQTRQRLSLLHELKHIIDHRFRDLTFQEVPKNDRAQFVEQLCDYFAGCVLVPRSLLKKAYGLGIQRPDQLASLFNVSRPAIQTRLSQTGLSQSTGRCSYQRASTPSSVSYYRDTQALWMFQIQPQPAVATHCSGSPSNLTIISDGPATATTTYAQPAQPAAMRRETPIPTQKSQNPGWDLKPSVQLPIRTFQLVGA